MRSDVLKQRAYQGVERALCSVAPDASSAIRALEHQRVGAPAHCHETSSASGRCNVCKFQVGKNKEGTVGLPRSHEPRSLRKQKHTHATAVFCNELQRASLQQAALSNTKSYLSPAIDSATTLNLSAAVEPASKTACPVVKTGASSPVTARALLAAVRKLWWEGRIWIYGRHWAFCLNASSAMSTSCRRLMSTYINARPFCFNASNTISRSRRSEA